MRPSVHLTHSGIVSVSELNIVEILEEEEKEQQQQQQQRQEFSCTKTLHKNM